MNDYVIVKHYKDNDVDFRGEIEYYSLYSSKEKGDVFEECSVETINNFLDKLTNNGVEFRVHHGAVCAFYS
ncbi:hypothetical protein [Paenibacillus tianjinensis]|uniref:Phage protein n=1 Tax=Paenibacillus tianjinensis TaxID=2810347 RepID=A0ABX7L613_9BACL|nr:hypothetical protein [Paenibacillus tianjinensis]QSF43389.1 hypothetical protein JRJ22_19170 [Paenibacillus tianjinensis]